MSTVQDAQKTKYFDTNEFVNDLVQVLTGYSIDELEETNRDEVVTKCISIFENFLFDYISTKYGKKDTVRLKSVQIFGDSSIFDKFPDLEDKFLDAFRVFLESVS
jgi:hypothetical protein